jgi:hypothetical protein
MIGRPLMVMPCATASSRAGVTGRPWLLAPSPEMSMTRRVAVRLLSARSLAPKSMAPDTEVRGPRRVGCAASRSAKAIALSASSITIHGTITLCSKVAAHSP